jgi:ketosteroid isomerase-like protein
MSQENVEAVKRVSALEEAGDEDAVRACFDADVEWRVINAGRLSESGRGVDSLRQWFSPAKNPLIDGEVPTESVDIVDAGDYVDAIPDTDIEEASVFEFRDGKIIRCTFGYPSMAEALKAVRLAG